MNAAQKVDPNAVDQQTRDSNDDRTPIKWENLCPEWNHSFNFTNIDDEDLQENFCEIKVMDRDSFLVSDKLIGVVNIDFSALL